MDGWRIAMLPGDERGQAAVEYAILAGMTVALVAGLYVLVVENGIFFFYQDTATLICLPIP